MLFPSLWFKACRWRCSEREKDFPHDGKVHENFFLTPASFLAPRVVVDPDEKERVRLGIVEAIVMLDNRSDTRSIVLRRRYIGVTMVAQDAIRLSKRGKGKKGRQAWTIYAPSQRRRMEEGRLTVDRSGGARGARGVKKDGARLGVYCRRNFTPIINRPTEPGFVMWGT